MTERVVLPIHGQDHCPGGPDPIPCFPSISFFRAVRWDADITVPGASRVVVDWDEWENSNENVFTPLDTSLDPADPGEVVRRVRLDITANPGRYTFVFSAAPDSLPLAGTVEMAMHDGDPIYGRPDSMLHGAADVGAAGLSVGFYTFNLSRVYPLYDPFDSGTHTPEISFTLAQNGGSSETFIYGLMEIHYEPHVSFP